MDELLQEEAAQAEAFEKSWELVMAFDRVVASAAAAVSAGDDVWGRKTRAFYG